MPTPAAILDSLGQIATVARPVAVLWHVVFGLVLIALAIGWRPSRRVAALLLTTPLASVGVISLLFRSPFNGIVFITGALALGVLGVGLPSEPVARGSAPATLAGGALIVFGWVYPHFFAGSPLLYLYAAPTGLVPCPTLAVVTGFALLADCLGARAWPAVLAGMGLFYGLFGTLRLGVAIDVGLLFGAAALLGASWSQRTAVSSRPRSA